MKSRTSLDTVAASVLTMLVVLVSLTIFLGENAGIQVSVDVPKDGIVGPYQNINIKFSEAYDPEIASDLISIDPVQEGYLTSVDNYNMRFVPLKPFQRGITYTFKVKQGEITINGREVKKAHTWQFQVRDPQVAYLVSDKDHSSIWTVDLKGGEPKRLTDENIKVGPFDVSQNGDFIIFITTPNDKGGVDLWRVGRDGSNASVLLDCGFDRCTTPAISPDGKRIAYSREAAGPSPNLPFGSPRIWLVDLESGSNGPVYEDQQILGYGPTWSPDSQKLASFDGLSDNINVIDLKSGQHYLFHSSTGGPVSWSPDSTKLLYTDFVQTGSIGHTEVYLADLSINNASILIGQNDTYDYSYFSLAWSSRNDRAVLSMRENSNEFTQSLWVFNPGTLDGVIIANDPEYAYNSPLWDPWGENLLFQQLKLRSQYNPEIGIWRADSNASTVLVNGVMPHWLP